MSRHDVVERTDESARLRALDALQVLDSPRQALVVVSDGIPDVFDTPTAALEALSELGDRGLSAQQLVEEITAYADPSRPQDDVTVVSVKRRAGLERSSQAGGLRIASAQEQVRMVLDLTRLDRILRPLDSVGDAVQGW